MKGVIKVKAKKIINSFKFAFEGIVSSFKAERNMKIHVLMMILVIIAGMTFEITKLEWILCMILFYLTLTVL